MTPCKTYLSEKFDVDAPDFEGIAFFPCQHQLVELSNEELKRQKCVVRDTKGQIF